MSYGPLAPFEESFEGTSEPYARDQVGRIWCIVQGISSVPAHGN